MGLHKDIYSTSRWQRLRLKVLVEHPLCHDCGRAASEVHHVVALSDGGDPWDPNNLMALCSRCHALRTHAEVAVRQGRVFRRKGYRLDGTPLAGWAC